MAQQFIIEDGSGKADANSYATTEEANQYLENSGRRTGKWVSGGTADQRAALAQAFFYMLARWEGQWLGRQANELQSGSWPQRGQFYPSNHAVADNEIPLAIKNSQTEYAYAMLNGELEELAPVPVYDDTGRTVIEKTEKVDVLQETTKYSEKGGYGRSVDGFRAYPIADALLKPFVTGGASGELLRL